ncbi:MULTISPECIES: ABC transporter permease [Schaalia]|uniref:ABC transporter permease n=1 Tax=Schaalia TaxID=2529408 RepID=UPI0026E9A1FC|nr:ABC transporter permease [Schaalia hyovaginalis]MCI6411265.1 ABC transporter permease [Schaalia hyovaginalis]MCI7512993.1 ABC transporter permease [Schaalia hyovaginalis]MDY4491586.1 ABC transporter permease [Schaalia hyovaginalis]
MSSRQNRGAEVGEWLATTLVEVPSGGSGAVATWRLAEVSARPTLVQYIGQLWNRRLFIAADARAKAFATSRGTILGKVWLVLRPFLDAFVYFVIFGLLLKTGRGVENFLAYLVVGLNVFGLVQSGLASGSGILSGGKNLIRAFSFPRASLVFSWAIRTLLDFIPVLIASIAFIVVVPPRVMPVWTWILIIPVIAITWIFSVGTALVVASLTARIPDLKFIWPLFTRFWFYGSGVFFSIDSFAEHARVHALMVANPGYQAIALARNVLVYGTPPTVEEWLYMSIWAGGMLVLGLVVFWSHEESYGRES